MNFSENSELLHQIARQLQQEIAKEKNLPIQNKYAEFVRAAWSLIEPARPYRENFCTGAVCEHLQAVSDGQIKKLIINEPPGMAKSTLVSVLWPVWEWINKPFIRWMFASHRMQLAFRDASRRRLVISSIWYKENFGESYTLTGENLKYFTNDKMGSMFSSSVDSQDVLGFRAHRLVLDDPHDPQGAISEVQRATTTEWLNLTWPTRKDDTKYSAEVLVMQRLHELDATGLYLKQDGWTHLKIPMEHKGKVFCANDPRRTVGELIDESVQSREYVEDKKRRLGEWGEAAQYDQEPRPIGGGLIRERWMQDRWVWSKSQTGYMSFKREGAGYLYNIDPWKSFRFCVVDLAMTVKQIGAKKLHDPDYTVMGAFVAHSTPGGVELLLVDLLRMRMEGPDSLIRLREFSEFWKFSLIAVEDIAEKDWYQQAKRLRLPVREISTSKNDEEVIYTIDKDKVSRVYAHCCVLMSNGRFHPPEYAPWLGEYISELTGFPNQAHDDQVDITSAACAIAEKYTGRSDITERAVEQKVFPAITDRSHPALGDRKSNPLDGYIVDKPRLW